MKFAKLLLLLAALVSLFNGCLQEATVENVIRFENRIAIADTLYAKLDSAVVSWVIDNDSRDSTTFRSPVPKTLVISFDSPENAKISISYQLFANGSLIFKDSTQVTAGSKTDPYVAQNKLSSSSNNIPASSQASSSSSSNISSSAIVASSSSKTTPSSSSISSSSITPSSSAVVSSSSSALSSSSVVIADVFGVHGKLTTNGNKIVDKNSQQFQIKAISMFYSAWIDQWGDGSAVSIIKSWGANAIRLPAYEALNQSTMTISNQATNIHPLIDSAIAQDLYIILAYNTDDYSNTNVRANALTYFKEILTSYSAQKDRFIFEMGIDYFGGTWDTLKTIHSDILSNLRQDYPNLYLAGTPNWSQTPHSATTSPITQFSNIAYLLQFAAGSHDATLFKTYMNTTLNNGFPVFSLWYGQDAAGSGAFDVSKSSTWQTELNNKSTSFCIPFFHEKTDTSPLITNFTTKALSTWGQWVKANAF